MAIGISLAIPFKKPFSWSAWLARMKNDLIQASLWSDNDRIFLFVNNIDYLKDITGKGLDATATNALHTPGRGVYQNTTGSINLNYNPHDNGISYTQNDAALVIVTIDDFRNGNALALAADATAHLAIYQLAPGINRLVGVINNITDNTTDRVYLEGNMSGVWIKNRKNTTTNLWLNGVKLSEKTKASSGVPDVNVTTLGSAVKGRIGLIMLRAGLTDAQALTMSNIIIEAMTRYGAYKPSDVFSNNYIYYKQTGSKIISDQNGDKIFAASCEGIAVHSIHYSGDSGVTWTTRAMTNAQYIGFSYVFSNGNVLFADYNKIYLWSNKAVAPTEVTPTDKDGNPITIHTPASGTYPGDYYRRTDTIYSTIVGTKEMIAWGNYGNTDRGANPVMLFHAFDDGVVKIDYVFGQNTYFRDNGTANGGTTGTLLGDPLNTVMSRHIHCVTLDSATNKWYAISGDFDHLGGSEREVHWLEGEYDNIADRIIWSVIVTGSETESYKGVGLFIKDGYFYWGADSVASGGVWKCLISDIAIIGNHSRLLTETTACGIGMLEGNNILVFMGVSQYNYLYCSNDGGVTWEKVFLSKLSGNNWFHAPTNKDSNGFRVLSCAGHNQWYAGNSTNLYLKFK